MSASTVSTISKRDLKRRLLREGLRVEIGPFAVELQSNVAEIADLLHEAYADYPLVENTAICDLHVRVRTPIGPRRWLRPKVSFHLDNETPFEPMPRKLAYPILEWGINYGIAMRSHQFLMLHSAVVARSGRAIIMPGLPGNGKNHALLGTD